MYIQGKEHVMVSTLEHFKMIVIVQFNEDQKTIFSQVNSISQKPYYLFLMNIGFQNKIFI